MQATTNERALWSSDSKECSSIEFAIGLDEAGRGCMAGPVVVSAVLVKVDPAKKMPFSVDDSKMLTEKVRQEKLEEVLSAIQHDSSTWEAQLFSKESSLAFHPQPHASSTLVLAAASCLRSSDQIDEMNISNASLEGMAQVCHAVVEASLAMNIPLKPHNTAIYIDGKVLPWTFLSDERRQKMVNKRNKKRSDIQRVGTEYPLLEKYRAKAVVSGDKLLYCVASASILSKVMRDNYCTKVMHVKCPTYDFKKHKGYCTTRHRQLLEEQGASPYHRRSFLPVQDIISKHK